MTALWLSLASFTLAQSVHHVADYEDARSVWEMSIQSGAARLDGTSAVLIRPRLATQTRHGSLALALPLWADGQSLGQGASLSQSLHRDPNTAGFWLAAIENAQTRWGPVHVHLGPVRDHSMGYGGVVGHYNAYLDPLAQTAGFMAQGRFDHGDMALLCDSLAAPRLCGISTTLRPLSTVAPSWADRLRLVGDAAVAPATTDFGAAAALGLLAYRSHHLAIDLFINQGFQGRPSQSIAQGTHGGLRVEWLEGGLHLGAQVQAIWRDGDYRMAAFDSTTVVDASPSFVRPEKVSSTQSENPSWRGSMAATYGSWHVRMHGDFDQNLGGRAGLGLRYEDPQGSIQLAWLSSAFGKDGSLLEAKTHRYVYAEAATPVGGGFFLFSKLYRGPRQVAQSSPFAASQSAPGDGLPTVLDWTMGIGYADKGYF